MTNLPDGYPTIEDDPMGLRMDIEAEPNVIKIKFSKPIISLNLNPQQTRTLAIALLTNAESAQNLITVTQE